MKLKTSYTISELKSKLSNISPKDSIGAIFYQSQDAAQSGGALGFLFDNSVESHKRTEELRTNAQPYMMERFKPDLAIERLKVRYGASWEPITFKREDGTSSVYKLNPYWDQIPLFSCELEEQLAHFFVDCAFVLNRNIHIGLTNHRPITFDFSHSKETDEDELDKAHDLIVKLFNIGPSNPALTEEMLLNGFAEKKANYDKCVYIGHVNTSKEQKNINLKELHYIPVKKIQAIFHDLSKLSVIINQNSAHPESQVSQSQSAENKSPIFRETMFATRERQSQSPDAAAPSPAYVAPTPRSIT